MKNLSVWTFFKTNFNNKLVWLKWNSLKIHSDSNSKPLQVRIFQWHDFINIRIFNKTQQKIITHISQRNSGYKNCSALTASKINTYGLNTHFVKLTWRDVIPKKLNNTLKMIFLKSLQNHTKKGMYVCLVAKATANCRLADSRPQMSCQ